MTLPTSTEIADRIAHLPPLRSGIGTSDGPCCVMAAETIVYGLPFGDSHRSFCRAQSS